MKIIVARRSRRLAQAAASLMAITTLWYVAAATPAIGSIYQYHYGYLASDSRDASPSFYSLNSSWAQADGTNHKIDAGAHYPGGWDLYAHWAEAWYVACHNYGGEYLGALVWNPHTVSQNPVTARAGYDGSYC